MARSTSTNYSTPSFSKATVDADPFDANDVQQLAAAVDGHDHTSGKGATLAAGAITSGMIADGTIVAGDIADGAVTSAKILDGTIATADHADASVTNAKLASDTARANLLTNSSFEVNQRGGPVTANNAYAHDRWQILLGGSSTISVTDETTIVDTGSGHSLKAVYTHNANSQINQKIEDYMSLRGRTLSLSIRVRQGSASSIRPYISDSGTKTYGTASATTGSFVSLTVSLAIGAGATSVNIGADVGASNTFYIDNAMLVVGSVAADYAPLHPADDLARCLRYYERFVQGGDNATGSLIWRGYASAAAQQVGGTFAFKVRKAVFPTVTFPAGWGTTNVSSGPSLGGSGIDGCDVYAAAAAAGYCTFYNSTAGSGIVLEANP